MDTGFCDVGARCSLKSDGAWTIVVLRQFAMAHDGYLLPVSIPGSSHGSSVLSTVLSFNYRGNACWLIGAFLFSLQFSSRASPKDTKTKETPSDKGNFFFTGRGAPRMYNIRRGIMSTLRTRPWLKDTFFSNKTGVPLTEVGLYHNKSVSST